MEPANNHNFCLQLLLVHFTRSAYESMTLRRTRTSHIVAHPLVFEKQGRSETPHLNGAEVTVQYRGHLQNLNPTNQGDFDCATRNLIAQRNRPKEHWYPRRLFVPGD